MNLRCQIEVIRRRFWEGDESARDALQCLLRRYVRVIARRAARRAIAPFDMISGVRTDRYVPPRAADLRECGPGLTSEGICRRLCDELLRRPSEEQSAIQPLDTIRASFRTLFRLRRVD